MTLKRLNDVKTSKNTKRLGKVSDDFTSKNTQRVKFLNPT